MSKGNFPKGWDDARVRRVLEHYERQTEEEAVAEDEDAFQNHKSAIVELPHEMLPVTRELIAKHQG